MDEDEARKAGLPLGLTPHVFPPVKSILLKSNAS